MNTEMFKTFLDCAYAGLKFVGMSFAVLGFAVVVMTFVTWGFTDKPTAFGVLTRMAIFIWLLGTTLSCMTKRQG